MTAARRILVVDDEEPTRRNLKAYLEDLGYEVSVAANGREALDASCLAPVDLVLTDLRMPEMGGIDLVRALRQSCPDTPVVIVSGAGDVRDAIAAINEGAWDYVVKPVEHRGQIEVVMQRAFERARLLEENRRHQANLEATVAERTAQLRERAQTLRIVADNTFAWETWEAPDGRFLYCSPSCLRITGYSREEFTGDSTLLDRIVHPEDRGRISSHLSSVDEAPAHQPLVFRIVRLDGAVRWIEHECQPIHAEDGTFLGRRGSHRDHTERRNLELQILRMQRQESLGRIASGVAHDLNNILSPIMMAGDLLQSSALDPAAQRYVELLRSSAARGADLVKQLLLYSRGIDAQPSDVDLCEEVRSALRLVTETFPKHIDIRLNLPSERSPIGRIRRNCNRSS